MGMPIVLDLRDELDADVVESMWNVLRQADAIFSTYKDDSEISRLNRGELALEDAHPDVREVLALCDAAARDHRRLLRRGRRLGGWCRSIRAREGLVGRSRGRGARRGGCSQLLAQRRRRHPPARAAASRRAAVAGRDPASGGTGQACRRRRGKRSGDRNLGGVPAGRARRRPAHGQGAGGRALGDDRRARSWRPPTPMQPPRSRWARPARNGRPASACTRR